MTLKEKWEQGEAMGSFLLLYSSFCLHLFSSHQSKNSNSVGIWTVARNHRVEATFSHRTAFVADQQEVKSVSSSGFINPEKLVWNKTGQINSSGDAFALNAALKWRRVRSVVCLKSLFFGFFLTVILYRAPCWARQNTNKDTNAKRFIWCLFCNTSFYSWYINVQ